MRCVGQVAMGPWQGEQPLGQKSLSVDHHDEVANEQTDIKSARPIRSQSGDFK